MINDREFLYGAAFLRIINFGVRVSLTHLSQIHSSVYLLTTDHNKAIILFKVSTKPTSAWSFVFSGQEEEGIIKLQNRNVESIYKTLHNTIDLPYIGSNSPWET